MNWGRKVAVIRHSGDQWYSVRFKPNWLSFWKEIRESGGKNSWDYTTARFIADQCFKNGSIKGDRYYEDYHLPIIELYIEE